MGGFRRGTYAANDVGQGIQMLIQKKKKKRRRARPSRDPILPGMDPPPSLHRTLSSHTPNSNRILRVKPKFDIAPIASSDAGCVTRRLLHKVREHQLGNNHFRHSQGRCIVVMDLPRSGMGLGALASPCCDHCPMGPRRLADSTNAFLHISTQVSDLDSPVIHCH
jgi:hypothetical protein